MPNRQGATITSQHPVASTSGRAPITGAGPARLAHVGGLDGLRAIAVVAVVLYHLDVPWLPGGFLGVDVFFVISGYLITSQLWARSAVTGRVDLVRFWTARIRRLWPALAATLVGASVLSLLFDRPQLRSYLGDLAAAATYTSNWWYVIHQRSYFAGMGRPPVLQHLWSLAVEEQFYLIWPLVVALVLGSTRSMAKRQRRLLLTCLVLGAASGIVMGVGTALAGAPQAADPSRFYFGTDAHASGLLFGAALATLRAGRGFTRTMGPLRRLSPRALGVGLAALAGVVWCFFEVDAWTVWFYRIGFVAFPLATCLLVVAATRDGLLQRVLDLPPLAALGRRSYGLYLWHWPVIVFTRPGIDLPLGTGACLVLRVVLMLAVTELSYRLVEAPTRRLGLRGAWRALREHPIGRWSARQVLVAAVGLLALALAIGAATSRPVAEHDVALTPVATAAATAKATPEAAASALATRTLSVYGDSVVLEAVPRLRRQFRSVSTHAVVGEQPWTLLDELSAAAPTMTSDVLLVHTGNNGAIDRSQMERTLAKVPDHTLVVLVVPRVPKPWQSHNLDVLHKVAQDMPRVRVADWYSTSAGHPDWFVDGVHMNTAATARYVAMVDAAITGG